MKVHLVTALGAAALLVACSGSNKETRTASNTGTTTQGPVEGTQSAAGSQGQVATQGSSTATPGSASDSTTSGTTGAPASGTSTDTSSMGSDRSGQSNTSSTYGQSNPSTGSSSSSATPGSSTGSTYGQGGTGSSGSTYGQGGTGSSGSTYGQGGTAPSDGSMGTSGSSGSTDRTASSSANLKSAVGRVSKVDPDSKSVVISSRQGDRITLTVDDNTQIVDSSGSSTSDLSAIREGTPVRATFDPASNRAEKIEVMGKASKKAMHKESGSSSDTTGSMDRSDSSTKARAPDPDTGKNPAQAPDTTPPSDQKQ